MKYYKQVPTLGEKLRLLGGKHVELGNDIDS